MRYLRVDGAHRHYTAAAIRLRRQPSLLLLPALLLWLLMFRLINYLLILLANYIWIRECLVGELRVIYGD